MSDFVALTSDVMISTSLKATYGVREFEKRHGGIAGSESIYKVQKDNGKRQASGNESLQSSSKESGSKLYDSARTNWRL